jgi:trehalose-6-phosphatase
VVRRSVFDRILREMQEIRYRLDDIENSISSWNPPPLEVSESELFTLPDHLRKSYLTVASKGECTATEVSDLTGRCRAIESNYLNQLVRAGWLAKRRNSKAILFRLVSRKHIKEETLTNIEKPERKHKVAQKVSSIDRSRQPGGAGPRTMSLKCLSSDYDGTLSPLTVPRNESHVPLETGVMLRRISRSLPISVFTMKDLGFVMPRTPFANAWSAIGGLEMQIGKRVLKRESLESKLSSISDALAYARSHITAAGVEIEEKQNSEGCTLAFCVDWRQTKDPVMAKRETEVVAEYCKALGLGVFRYQKQPFYDVYPVVPDKGRALQETLKALDVKEGVLYLGDSEMDNSAFRVSNVSVGVLHDDTPLRLLDCDYLVKFEEVPSFLKALLANGLQFRSDFPMVRINTYREKPLEHVSKDQKPDTK